MRLLAVLGCCAAACVQRSAGEEVGSEGGSGGGDDGIACGPFREGCEPFDAEGVGDCRASFGWAWDGADCVAVTGCSCEGEDCCRLPDSYESCVDTVGECHELALCLRCPEGTQCMQYCAGAGYCDAPTCVECDGCPCSCADDMFETCMNGGGRDYVGVDLVCQGFGRPFVVQGQARQAVLATGQGWSATARPSRLRELDAFTRRRLADAWSEQALAEHASIASFARFLLDLLAVGAPAEFVREAAIAMQDEVEHARICFAFASAYAGVPMQPGPLPTGDATSAGPDLATLAAATVSEGCVGETLAALEAAAAARACVDPAVRDVLDRIAAEELRHAELAWQVVRWALAVGGEPVRAAVASAFARTHAPPVAGSDRARDLAAHGVLDPDARRRLHAAVLRDAILPCATALLRGRAFTRANGGSVQTSHHIGA